MSDVQSASSDSEESALSAPARSDSPPETEWDAKEVTADEPLDQQAGRAGADDAVSSMVEGNQRLRDFEGVHLTFPPADGPSQDSADNEEATTTDSNVLWDFVIVPGVFDNWEKDTPAGQWVTGYANSPARHRILRFEYDSQSLFAGCKSREGIRSCALRLLRGLTALRKGESQKRVINFITHDLGGVIVKDALVAAALDPGSWSDVLDMSRILVFTGYPHRSKSQLDMEDRLCRFLFASYGKTVTRFTPSIASVPGLASAVIETNGLFVDSKAVLRSRCVSIHAGLDAMSHINPVFDVYGGTLGVPFEKRILAPAKEDDGYPDLTSYLDSLNRVWNAAFDDDTFLRERKLLSAASPIDPFRTTKEPKPSVTESSEFKTWLDSPGLQILYIHGSHDVQHAAEQVFFALDEGVTKQRTVVLYFSFDRWDVRRDSIRDMASTFLAQIICQFPHGRKDWAQFYLNQQDCQRAWTEADLVYLLERFRVGTSNPSYFERVIYVINNFDDCAKGSRKFFLDNFKYLVGSNESQSFKVVVTSMKTGVLLSELSDTSITSLDLSTSAAALPHQLGGSNGSPERLTQLRPDLLLQATLLRQELGFIADIDPLARQIICEQARVQPEWPERVSIQKILGDLDLPKGQWDDDTLATLLSRILWNIPAEAELQLLLSWVLYSLRPLTIWELGTALYLNSSSHDNGLASPPRSALDGLARKLRIWLAGIADVDHNEVRISHPRLRNVLMGKGLAKRENDGQGYPWDDLSAIAHFDIARLCLKYLSQESAREIINGTHRIALTASGVHIFGNRENLCSYALQAWTYHFQKVTSAADQATLTAQFTSALTTLGRDWARSYWALSNPMTRAKTCVESLYPIFAGLGHLDVVKARDMQDDCFALQEAAAKGRSQAVRDLLRCTEFSEAALLDALVSAGASGKEQLVLDLIQHILDNSDSPSTLAWPPTLIYRAAWLGLDRVAERLLHLGVSPDADAPWMAAIKAPPLYQAGRNSHLTTMRILVSHGADVKVTGENGRTILHMVAGFCDTTILRWMVREADFELDPKDHDGRTPLYVPAVNGNYAAVKELLQLGADPNMGLTPESEHMGWSPLVVAADDGFSRCVKLLLEHNAHPDIAGPTGNRTALCHAAINGHVDCCHALLVEGGADPNSPLIQPPIIVQTVGYLSTDEEQTCLDLLKLLIDNGADMNARDRDGRPVLASIMHCNNIDSVCEMLLDRGADVNFPDSVGRGPLFQAAVAFNPGLVKLLLARGADVNALDQRGFSPLHAGIPNSEVVRLLLKHGADPNLSRDSNGFTAVAYAASNDKYLGSLRLLIEHDAALETESCTGGTALNIAVSEGSAAAVRALAEAGANLQHKDSWGIPVLHHAACARGTDKLDAVLEFLGRVDINQTNSLGGTVLHLNNVELASFKRLVNAGAAINAQDLEGDTPLGSHAMLGNIQHVKYLLRHGADVNLPSKHHGGPLHLAARYTSDLTMVKLLVEHGADINLAAPVPGTPLAAACLYNGKKYGEDDKVQQQMAVIRYLLEHKANVSGQGGVLGCPINAAACYASPEVVDLLLSKGAQIDAKNALGVSPIHLAAYNSIDVFQSIIEGGGDIEARDLFGRTPLHCAAQSGRFEVIQRILSLHHFDDEQQAIDAADRDGWTALCWAARGRGGSTSERSPEELAEVVRLLLERGASRTVAVTAQGQKWTPLKIARYHCAPAEVVGLLEYGLGWDGQSKQDKPDNSLVSNPDDEKIPARRNAGSVCDGCQSWIYGFCHYCKTCTQGTFEFCFKCYPHRAVIHPPDHEFEEKGPEFEEEKEPKVDEEDGDTTDTSSTTSSDTDSDAESDS